jgi:hypothetical protein
MNLRGVAVAGSPVQVFAVALEYPGVIRIAQPCGRLHKRVEHDLQIEGGAADHL